MVVAGAGVWFSQEEDSGGWDAEFEGGFLWGGEEVGFCDYEFRFGCFEGVGEFVGSVAGIRADEDAA